jgi:TolB-like protein
MLAGHPPFVGASVESLIQQHLTAEPPNITGIRPAVPAHVAATLERALAKTPADRFNPVALFAEALGPRASAAVTAVPVTPATPLPRRFSWERIALLGIAAVVVIAGAVAVGSWLRGGSTGPRHPRTAIAVLPFENLRGEGPNAYFAGGLHDELLTQLSKVAALKVIGRTSVLTYANSEKRLSEIGDELAVGSIVEGSVQVVGNRLRVSVQLIDPVTETHLWAEHYDRTLDDAFAVQSDIAQRIVGAVGGTLTGAEAGAIAAMPTANAGGVPAVPARRGVSAPARVRPPEHGKCAAALRAGARARPGLRAGPRVVVSCPRGDVLVPV